MEKLEWKNIISFTEYGLYLPATPFCPRVKISQYLGYSGGHPRKFPAKVQATASYITFLWGRAWVPGQVWGTYEGAVFVLACVAVRTPAKIKEIEIKKYKRLTLALKHSKAEENSLILIDRDGKFFAVPSDCYEYSQISGEARIIAEKTQEGWYIYQPCAHCKKYHRGSYHDSINTRVHEYYNYQDAMASYDKLYADALLGLKEAEKPLDEEYKETSDTESTLFRACQIATDLARKLQKEKQEQFDPGAVLRDWRRSLTDKDFADYQQKYSVSKNRGKLLV